MSWRDYVAEWTRAHRNSLLERPWLLKVPRTGPPLGPRALRWLDRLLAALADTGLDPGAGISIASTLTGFAYSQAELAIHLRAGAVVPQGVVPQEVAAEGLVDYAGILGQVLDPVGYPALSALVRADGFGSAEEWVDDADFEVGLTLLLDGVEALATS